jgi:methionine-S-sulfoxide reductase
MTKIIATTVVLLGLLALIITPGVAMDKSYADLPTVPAGHQVATFGGGCFWCMEPPFDALDGVTATVVGYSGGTVERPSYQQVTTGRTGHVEAVQVVFDPKKVSYAEVVETFWRNIDPTQEGGQFADRGTHYRTVIFVHDEEQKKIAEASKKALGESGTFSRPIVTSIEEAAPFYPAEEYHQNYYKKNVLHYNSYKVGSGRAGFLEQAWGKK